MRSTSVVGVDGGIADAEFNVFCEQVLGQFEPEDRAVIEHVMDCGVIRDVATRIMRIRHRLYGRQNGIGWHRFRDRPVVQHVARKMGFI